MTYDRDPMRRYNLSARAEVEEAEDWRAVIDELPWLQFPEDWKVRIIPPFGGAMARFCVVNSHGAHVSVYADFHDRLGVVHSPYWEAHCTEGMLAHDEETPLRFGIDEADEMMACIGRFGDPVRNMKQALS